MQTDKDEPHVETTDNIVSLDTVTVTWHVETESPTNDAEHVETLSIRHVVMTDRSSDTTENAAEQHPTGNKVDAENTQEETENTTQAPTPTDDTAKVSYLHPLKMKKCTLKLKPLVQLDIDVWCNKVVDYPLKPTEPPQTPRMTLGTHWGNANQKLI